MKIMFMFCKIAGFRFFKSLRVFFSHDTWITETASQRCSDSLLLWKFSKPSLSVLILLRLYMKLTVFLTLKSSIRLPVIETQPFKVTDNFLGGKKYAGHLIFLWSLNGCQSCIHLVNKTSNLIKVRFSPTKNICFICFNESPLKIMKNYFYFIWNETFYS